MIKIGRIQIGNYYIYPAFWFLCIGIFVGGVFIFSVILKIKQYIRETQFEKIKNWQRNNIVKILKAQIKESTEQEKILEQLLLILKSKKIKKWTDEHFLKVNNLSKIILSKILFHWTKLCLISHYSTRAVLLLYTIDCINGGPIYQGKKLMWMDSDLTPSSISFKIKGQETQLRGICETALDSLDEQIHQNQKAYETGETPEFQNSLLQGIEIDQMNDAIDDFENTPSIFNIQSSTRELIKRYLIIQIEEMWQEITEPTVGQYRLSYIRALACLEKNQPYPEIITEIISKGD